MNIGDTVYVVVYSETPSEIILGDLDGPFICESEEEAVAMLDTLDVEVDAEIIKCVITDE